MGALRGASRGRLIALGAAGAALAGAVVVSALLDDALVARAHGVTAVVWAGLAVALVAASVGAAAAGLRHARAVDGVASVPWPRLTAVTLGSLLGVVGTIILYGALDAGDRAAGWRGGALTIGASAGGAFVVRAYLGIAAAVRAPVTAVAAGARVARYLALRDAARALLRPLGALVALATFALGAARLEDGAGPESALEVLGFGMVGTALVAGSYAIARVPLRAEASRLRDALAPVETAEPDRILARLREREEAERLLGLSGTLLSELQSGVWVVGPLLVAASGLLLP